MLDVKEGDALALPMGSFAPPKKLTVIRVLGNRFETNDGNAWNIKTGVQWASKSGDRVHPWGLADMLLVESYAAQRLAFAIEKRLRGTDIGTRDKAAALPYLRDVAKVLGLEVK